MATRLKRLLTRQILGLLIGTAFGCSHQEGPVVDEALKIDMPEISKEVYFPSQIFESILGVGKEKGSRKSGSMVFAPLRVRLIEKTEGLLPQPEILLSFPKGGGEVDFAKYLKKDKGTFGVKFELGDMETGEDQKIYFVSRSKKRKLDDGIYGSGCRAYFNVKNYVQSQSKGEGLIVNVTRDRHASALGGSFIFSSKKDSQTQITQVSFVDSRRPDLFCEDTKR
jgi:hypothetical protein